MDLNHLPIIDWDKCLKLAAYKSDLAEEILTRLVKTLPADVASINNSYAKQNHTQLLHLVHKLHGALCYCGLPRLKTLIAHLETELKSNIMSNLPSLLNQLDTEVNLLLEHHPKLPTIISSKDKTTFTH